MLRRRPRHTLACPGAVPGRRAAALLLVLAAGGIDGCAALRGRDPPAASSEAAPHPQTTIAAPTISPTVVGYEHYPDPLIRINRAFFAFNDVAYRYLFIPVSHGYMRVTSAGVRKGVSNFFYNLKTPIYAVNHLLQWQPKSLGKDLLRFGINTTVGVLGIFDPARSWLHVDREETHLEDTLRGYGAGHGVYLVLPIFGPSDVRNGVSLIGDYLLNPIPYLTKFPESTEIQSFDYLQDYAPGADRYTVIRTKSKDPYLFFRNLYLQGEQRNEDY